MPALRPTIRILLNLLLASAFLRLYHVDHYSLWLDEGVTWSNATQATLPDTVFAEANHPPVWWVVTRASIAVLGDSEFSLRLPAAILGLVSVLLAFFLARRLTDPMKTPSRGGFAGVDEGAAIWVAGLAAASAFWIQYAQEARMYSALLAESLGLSLLYLRWLDGGKRWCLVAYGLLAAIALYTHYFAALFLAGHAVAALLLAPRGGAASPGVSPKPLFAALSGAALLFAPWFVHLLRSYTGFAVYAHDPLGRVAHALWRIGVGPGLVAFDSPRTGTPWSEVIRDNLSIIVPSALLWGIPIGFGVRAFWRDRGARAFLLSCVLVPIGSMLAVFPWFPLIEDKYLVFLAPPLLLLAVVGARTAPLLLRPLLLAGLLLLTLAGMAAYHFSETEVVAKALTGEHPYGKEQWREAEAWVDERKEPGDVVLLQAPYLRLVWDYYDRKTNDRGLLPFGDATADEVLKQFPQIARAKHVFLVLAHETTEDHDHFMKVLRELWLRPELLPPEASVQRIEFKAFPRSWGIRVFEFVRE